MTNYKGLELALEYKYGCIFTDDKKIYFINNNDIYCKNKGEEVTIINTNDEIYNDIKKIFEERFYKIYEKSIQSELLDEVKICSKKPTRRMTGGSDKLEELRQLFYLPAIDDRNPFETFYRNLTTSDRNYICSTRDFSEVKAVLLCFFHINDFDISGNSPSFIFDNTRPYHIISEQETITPKILEETRNKKNRNELMYPVNVDIENINRDNKREYFLSDGNHRINILKELNYDGYVPVIVCDYLDLSNRKRKGGGYKKRLLKKY